MPRLMDGRYPEEMVDAYAGKRCVVAASGHSVYYDLADMGWRTSQESWDVITVNDMIMHFPGAVEHAYSNDRRMLPRWIQARRPGFVEEFGLPQHVHTLRHGLRWSWPFPGHGTSTLNAVYLALTLGYDPVVICGAPLDNRGHYFDAPWVETKFEKEVSLTPGGQMQYWAGAKAKWFGNKVFAMSGRTAELLGRFPQ